uniref:Reverse transcriptase domain-containing protein n=1 Tax=Tanacetum cinerariifolium TaxID=118510 RepID=A0A699K357_TANCI|nr:reverse transcriptase domain-containing protein [Tanacetum cinerariifolium]
MRTHSSLNLVGESSPNPTSLNPELPNRRLSKQPFILEESPIDMMPDQRTMAELLRVPTEGYAEAIVVPPILAEHLKLKHSLINMMTSNQFFGLEKDDPHDHIHWIIFKDTFQQAVVNYNKGNYGYLPSSVVNQIRPLGFAQPNVQNNQNLFSQPQGYNRGNNFNQDTSYQAPIQQNKFFQMNTAFTSGLGPLPSNTIANPKGEVKAITTRSGLVLDGSSVPMPPPFINLEEDKRAYETLTYPKLAEYTIKVPPPLVQKAKPHSK